MHDRTRSEWMTPKGRASLDFDYLDIAFSGFEDDEVRKLACIIASGAYSAFRQLSPQINISPRFKNADLAYDLLMGGLHVCIDTEVADALFDHLARTAPEIAINETHVPVSVQREKVVRQIQCKKRCL